MPKKYRFNRNQLAQYIDAFTGEQGVVIRGIDHGANTHIPQRVVSLPIGAPFAQDLAAHEALHITSTSPNAARRLDEGTMMLLNSLEDGRMERKSFHAKKGLKVQFQRNLVDATMPQIKSEAWVIQAIKSLYLEVAGYEYDSENLKPRAREFAKRFRDTGLRDAARAAKTTEELLPIVERVFPLFDEVADQIKSRGRKAKAATQPEIVRSEARTGGQEPQSGTKQGDGQPSGSPSGSGTPSPVSAEGQDEAKTGSNGVGAAADGNDPRTDKKLEYTESETYDADERRNEREAAARMGDHTVGEISPSQVNVNGNDKVVGGATSQSIRNRARALAKKVNAINAEAASLWETADVQAAIYAPQPQVTASQVRGGAMSDPNWDPSDLGTDSYGRSNMVKVSVGSGKVGYDGTEVRVDSVADTFVYGEVKDLDDAAKRLVSGIGGYANALSLQMRTFSQTRAGRKQRSFERNGRLDVRRATQASLGKMDIFKQQDSGRSGGSAFVLSVDLSGSMNEGAAHTGNLQDFDGELLKIEGRIQRLAQDLVNNGTTDKLDLDFAAREYYGRRGLIPPIYYALQTTAMMSTALSKASIPHEVHTFSDYRVGIAKKFNQPLTTEVLGKMWTWGGGGTPAAEGLAVAWERLKGISATKKIVIQFTDGAVADNVRDLIAEIKREGGIVIGVGIGAQGIDDENKKMYGEFISCDTAADLPAQMAKLLRRLTMQGVIGGDK